MCVILEGKTEVTDVVNGVLCLHHGTQGYHLDEVVLWLAFTVSHQLVQALGGGSLGALGLHLVAELHHELTQGFQLLWVWVVVDTIRQRLRLLAFLYLADAFRNRAVGKEHEFLYKFVGILRTLVVATHRLALLVDVEVQFLSVELHGTILEASGTQFLRQAVESDELEGILALIWMLRCLSRCWLARAIHYAIGFEKFLYFLIFIAAVAFDDGMYDAIVLYLSVVVQLEDDAIRQFLLVRTEGADEVAETFWQHRNGAINEIDGCRSLHGFLVDDASFCYIV